MAHLNRRSCRVSPPPERCRFASAPKLDPIVERWRERMDAAAEANRILRRVVDAAVDRL